MVVFIHYIHVTAGTTPLFNRDLDKNIADSAQKKLEEDSEPPA